MDLNLTADFDSFDGLVAVTFYRRLTESTFAAGVTVPAALKRAVPRADLIASGGLLNKADTIWHIPSSALGSTSVKVSDVVQETDGTRWTVLESEHQTLTARWRLTCRREV